MQKINLDNLTEEQKELIFKIGLMKLGEIIFEGLVPVEKIRKNITYITEKTGLPESEIWACYKFMSEAAIDLGTPKEREKIGFKK